VLRYFCPGPRLSCETHAPHRQQSGISAGGAARIEAAARIASRDFIPHAPVFRVSSARNPAKFCSVLDIREHLAIVTLSSDEYGLAIQDAARGGDLGTTIYDALLAHCAIKVQADVVNTWNLRRFEQFPGISSRVKAP
jgi:hypothetical protein